MRGTITGYKPTLSGMFWINGDDGTVYFSHSYNTVDRSNRKHYLYNGNRATFDVIDEGKDHLTAINVLLDEVEDPDAEVKRQRRLEEAERRRLNEEKKAKAYVRNLEAQVRHYQKLEYESKYIRYVVQTHGDNGWETCYTNGKPVYSSDVYRAQEYVREHKQPGEQMRVKKAKVVRTSSGYQVKVI